MTLRTLSRRFLTGYAAVSAITLHVFLAGHYWRVSQTCTGYCLDAAIYGSVARWVPVALGVVTAGVIATDSVLARVYGGESR